MHELERLQRRLNRERRARKEAEYLLEKKSFELYQVNKNLQNLADSLEKQVKARTEELTVALDAAKSANLAKSQFLASMSHELRTPLNAIIGYSDIVIDNIGGRSDQNYADITKIKQAGGHLLLIINEILDLAKIEAGKMEINLDYFDTSVFLERLLAKVQPLASKNNNKFTLDNNDEFEFFFTDEVRLMQILTNLLSNACKFTNNGNINLSVTRHKVTEDNENMIFKVSDTGIGLSPDQLDMVFDAFVQVDCTPTRKYEGTGLGLAICQQFCKLLGGHIQVSSQLNLGSTFTVSLPTKTEIEPLAQIQNRI